ncbi:MAG: hypothetical protein IPM23_01610 [Candidatus Melainabacteria bacterium]|nr:hypothetical protein [Candidatus Melainabacteria bacterium]
MARLFTIFGDGYVKEGFDVQGTKDTAVIAIDDGATLVGVSEPLIAQCITPIDREPLRIYRASARISNGSIDLRPEDADSAKRAPADKVALVLLDPRCWWHSQTKLNSGITNVFYHVDPKNIILAGVKRFGAEGLTRCQAMLVRVDIGDEILIGWTKSVGQGGTLSITKETRTLIYTGETFVDVPAPVLYWRREVP